MRSSSGLRTAVPSSYTPSEGPSRPPSATPGDLSVIQVPIDQLALLLLVVTAAIVLVLLTLQFAWRGRRGQSARDRRPQAAV